jgi:hypothetical protein
MKWLRLQDEQLPTWAHTIVVFLIASVFGIPPIWWGISAIATRHLPEMREWDGQLFFQALNEREAVIAGWSLICLGLTFLTLGMGFTRWAEGRAAVRVLPWCCLALFACLYLWSMTFK